MLILSSDRTTKLAQHMERCPINQRAEDVLFAKIRQLPAERLAQIADFVDFLAAQERRREAIERLQALRDQLPPAEITEG
jgi:hypothetical protein